MPERTTRRSSSEQRARRLRRVSKDRLCRVDGSAVADARQRQRASRALSTLGQRAGNGGCAGAGESRSPGSGWEATVCGSELCYCGRRPKPEPRPHPPGAWARTVVATGRRGDGRKAINARPADAIASAATGDAPPVTAPLASSGLGSAARARPRRTRCRATTTGTGRGSERLSGERAPSSSRGGSRTGRTLFLAEGQRNNWLCRRRTESGVGSEAQPERVEQALDLGRHRTRSPNERAWASYGRDRSSRLRVNVHQPPRSRRQHREALGDACGVRGFPKAPAVRLQPSEKPAPHTTLRNGVRFGRCDGLIGEIGWQVIGHHPPQPPPPPPPPPPLPTSPPCWQDLRRGRASVPENADAVLVVETRLRAHRDEDKRTSARAGDRNLGHSSCYAADAMGGPHVMKRIPDLQRRSAPCSRRVESRRRSVATVVASGRRIASRSV